MSLSTHYEVAMCDAEGNEHQIKMFVCDRRTSSNDKCRVSTLTLRAKVPHVDCEPVELQLKGKTLTLGNSTYEVTDPDIFADCGKCATLYVIQLRHITVKCAQPIEVCRCSVEGEVGCNQVSTLEVVETVNGNVCPSAARLINSNDNRHHQKSYRIYMTREEALRVCRIDGTIIAKTEEGQIQITSENFEGNCPSVSGFLDTKVYETADA